MPSKKGSASKKRNRPTHRKIVSTRLLTIETRLLALITRMDSLMIKFDTLSATLGALNTVTNNLSTVADKILVNEAAQLSLIQSLRDQLAAGTPISDAQLDQLNDSATSTTAALTVVRDHLLTIASDPENPAPPVPPIDSV